MQLWLTLTRAIAANESGFDASGDPGIPVAIRGDRRRARSAHGARHDLGHLQHVRRLPAAMGLIPIDRVVTAQGKVVSRVPLLVVQPLETSVVRSIDVTEGRACMPATCSRG